MPDSHIACMLLRQSLCSKEPPDHSLPANATPTQYEICNHLDTSNVDTQSVNIVHELPRPHWLV